MKEKLKDIAKYWKKKTGSHLTISNKDVVITKILLPNKKRLNKQQYHGWLVGWLKCFNEHRSAYFFRISVLSFFEYISRNEIAGS